METIDDEIEAGALDYIKRQAKTGKPFFTWVNFTHMHARTPNLRVSASLARRRASITMS